MGFDVQILRRDHASSLPASTTLAARAEGAGLVGLTVADVERHLILNTLSHCSGNRTRAAQVLGISLRTLRNRLAAYASEGLAIPEPDGKRAAA